MTVRVLTEADVRSCLRMPDAVDAVDRGLEAIRAGRVDAPLRNEIRVPEEHILALFMPGRLGDLGALGQKTVTEFPANADRALPVLTASMVMHDPETGLVRALLAATHLTNVRTAALTAAAARRLAPAQPTTAALVGTGGLAAAQVEALALDPSITEVRVAGRRPERARAVAEQCAGLRPGLDVIATEEVREAVVGADVIATATSARTPVLEDDWVAPHALICAMGSNAPDMQELPSALLARASRVVADTTAGVVERSGDIVIPVRDGLLDPARVEELCEAATRAPEAPGPVVFKSCGFAAADLAIAAEVVSAAEAQGLGTTVELGQ